MKFQNISIYGSKLIKQIMDKNCNGPLLLQNIIKLVENLYR